MVPMAEKDRRTVPVRLLKVTVPVADEAKDLLQAVRGGTWSRGQAVHHVLREWLAIQRGEAPR